jgi:hypothetical protein
VYVRSAVAFGSVRPDAPLIHISCDAHGKLVGEVSDELARLEKAYATRPEFMDRATHLLRVARSRRVAPVAGIGLAPATFV